MGVLLGGTPVGRPAGVANPGPYQSEIPVAPGHGAGEVLQSPNLSDLLYLALPLEGEPRRIIPTVLEVPETLHEHFHTTFSTGVTHDAAHGPTFPSIHGWDPVGQREETGRQRPCPGPNGALSPASPPGFVTVLTTARSRDAPAECFDERLPRRLPHLAARVLALVLISTRKLRRSHRARWPCTAM